MDVGPGLQDVIYPTTSLILSQIKLNTYVGFDARFELHISKNLYFSVHVSDNCRKNLNGGYGGESNLGKQK